MTVSPGKIALGITDDEVPLGSHLIHFWHTDDEFERGVRFLELGIADESQYCVLFGHDEANQRVLEILRARGYDLARIQDDRLVVLRRETSASETLAKIDAACSDAVAKGAAAIRYLGNLGMGQDPLPGRGVDEVVELETGATVLADRYPSVIVCMYDINTLSGRLILDAGFGTHPLTVCRGALRHNPYYATDNKSIAALRLENMTAERQSATQTSEPLDLQMLIETIPAMVVCALPDGSVEFANRAWQEYTGGSLPQLRGSGWQTAMHPDDVRGFVEAWNANLPTGKPFAAEARMRRADGQYHWFLIRKALAIPPSHGGHSSVRALIACEDINERKQSEARLRQSETQLQAFFENSPSMIFLKDREGRYLYANREFKRVRRIIETHINGKTDSELFPIEQASVFQASDRQMLEAGIPIEFEQVTVERDGQHTSIVQKFPLFNPDGEIYAIGGIVTDITERKRDESARRYIEESHRLMVETASDTILSMDETGTILFANPATTTIFGYHPTELIGKPLTVLMPEFMRELHDTGFRRYLATGQRHLNWQGTELTALRKNGEEFPVEVSFGELTRDGHKTFTGFIREVSKRKHAEEKLRASERALRELTETIPQMLWSAEPDGAIDYCNQRTLDYTGLSAEQVRGAGWMKTVHRDDIENMSRAWTAAVSSGEPFQQEFRGMRAEDHAYRWCISRALPLRNQSGGIIKWFGTVVDLHDWKEAQQALQMTQIELARVSRFTTMGELAASIAHEVNQPLTAVTNNASACLRLLENRSLESDVLRRALQEIIADGTRASAIIARIRGFIKKAPAEKTELDVNEVIQEVLALAGHEFRKNQILVECQLASSLPLMRADRVQLQQVLLNLIMNGIEAITGAINRPRVLGVASRIDTSGNVLVEVRDSGAGLGLEADRLFTPFFTTKSNGMGMGLTISRSLIEGHGGRLWASPNSPHGAVFSFTLPAGSESSS